MIVGVFRLAYKTIKVSEGEPGFKYSYRLVWKDDLGNTISIKGSEDDYDSYAVGAILLLDSILRQTTMPYT